MEGWFRGITQRQIRRATFRSVKQLIAAIHVYLKKYNSGLREGRADPPLLESYIALSIEPESCVIDADRAML